MTAQSPDGLVAVQWALISKDAGSAKDYGILDGSGGSPQTGDLSGIAFSQIAGTPPAALRSREGKSTGPIWATFGAFPVEGAPGGGGRVLSVALQHPWQLASDSDGRPIWPKDFFACSYQDVAGASAPYRTLYHAVVGQLPYLETGQPAWAALGADSPGHVRELLARAEEAFDWLAAVAANLLDDKTVVVSGVQDLPLDGRLQLVDAIAALLPYGYRADLSASTEVGDGFTRSIRLILTDRPVDNVLTIDRFGHPPVPVTPTADKYYHMLLRKRSLLDQENRPGAREVLLHLWKQTEPRLFREPGPALQILEDFQHTADITWQARNERPNLELARKVFSERPGVAAAIWPGLPEKNKRGLIGQLIADPARESGRILADHWPVVGKIAIQLAQQRLDAGNADAAGRILHLMQASRPAEADGLLQELLLPTPTNSPVVGAGAPQIRARVALLRGLEPVPVPGEFPETCGALRLLPIGSWQPTLVLTLLTEELRDNPERARGWVTWLCESPPPPEWNGDDPTWHRPRWAEALAYAVRKTAEPPVPDSLRAVTHDAPDWAVTILRLAELAGRLPAVLRPLDLAIVWLAGQTTQNEGQRRDLHAVLATPLRGSLPEEDLAQVDSALFILGGQAVNFPDGESPGSRRADAAPDVEDYLAGLNRTLNTGELIAYRAYLETRFLAHALPVESQAKKRGGIALPSLLMKPGGTRLVIKWSTDQDRAPRLAKYIVENHLVTPILGSRELDPILKPLKGYPGLESFGPVGQLKATARRVLEDPERELSRTMEITPSGRRAFPATPLASAICDAYCARMGAEDILNTLNSVWGNSWDYKTLGQIAEKFYDVLTQCQAQLREHVRGEDDQRSVGEIKTYARVIVEEFGGLINHVPMLGPEFAELYAPTVREEAERRQRYFAALARDSSRSRTAARRWGKRYVQRYAHYGRPRGGTGASVAPSHEVTVTSADTGSRHRAPKAPPAGVHRFFAQLFGGRSLVSVTDAQPTSGSGGDAGEHQA